MDETRIRAVFQQPSYEIGQQIAMAAYWSIDSAVIALFMNQTFVQALTHAVEALEFEVARLSGPFEDC